MEQGTNQRIAFRPLKQKRRYRSTDVALTEEHQEVTVPAEPRVSARERIRKTGRSNMQWRRLTPPSAFMDAAPPQSHSPLLARVVDKVKQHPRFATSGPPQSVWALLRGWALESR